MDLKCDEVMLKHILPLILSSEPSVAASFAFSEYVNECHDPLKFIQLVDEDLSVLNLTIL
jgi:hypothetical protein